MLYGILGSEDTKLSSISRALHEPTEIRYMIKRLSCNLQGMETTPAVNQYMLRERLSSREENEIIAIEGGDIRKDFAARWSTCMTSMMGAGRKRKKDVNCFAWQLSVKKVKNQYMANYIPWPIRPTRAVTR